jgi:DNA-directed RNA polymerase omega subunit
VLLFIPVEEADELVEQNDAPHVPSEPAPPIQSRFLFVDVAALRAKQLRRGARVRFEAEQAVPAPHKPERIAMEEVRRGLVPYDVPVKRSGSEA